MDVSDSQVDETISLSDVLVARDTCLPEDELWALCRECCLVLEVVNNSPDMFETLCVTPDTVAFDQVGNVCFLDLDVDPEPIYLAPEHSDQGNSYKAHLFSLGMTLLYAAEYNVEHTKESISPELRELLGHMTADSPTVRPDLESTIILCEEQLCGQSSQEVCCGIATVAGFGLPQEEVFEDQVGTTSYITDISPEDFSRAESYLHSEHDDTTCCDDIPDLTEDVSQVESLPASEHVDIVITDTHDESLPLSDDTEMENRRRRRVSPQEGKSSWGFGAGLAKPYGADESTDLSSNKKTKPDVPKRTTLGGTSASDDKSKSSKSAKVSDGDLVVREFMSESDTDHSRIDSDRSQQDKLKAKSNGSNTANVTRTNSKHKERRTSDSSLKKSNSSAKDVTKDKNQNIKDYKPQESTKTVPEKVPADTQIVEADKTVTGSRDKLDSDVTGARSRRSKRKQGLTIADILDALERCLNEEELWALCKEGTAALQRKKKHLPAYLSPDTLLIRESGNVSFKAIPEEKPLEVIFMAPELQTKGELSEKTCLYGLSVTLRCAAGKKYGSVSSIGVSSELKDLLQYLSDSSPSKRPELTDIAKLCIQHSNGSNSDMVCAHLFAEAFKAITDKEELLQKKSSPVKEETVPPPSIAKPSAFKPTSNASFQPVKPAPLASNTGGGAFCPVPKKPVATKENEVSEPRIPSAFSSPATHFKPIILQQTAGSANEKTATIKEETPVSKEKEKPSSKAPSKSSSANSQKKTSPDSTDKDKEVVKKLKELKENLMKHSKPSMVKEIESEDKQQVETSKDGVSKSSTPSKKSLPTTPKKSRSSRTSERGGKKEEASGGALDAIFKEMQRQGNMPDTQSLAAAIAQHLQGHLPLDQSSKGDSVPKPTPELDMTVTSAQASLGQGQMLPNLNIPSQYHSQLVGQTMTLPQYGGGMIPGLPQFQFQHDPVTGFLQLVPVMTGIRPHSVHSNSGSVHSARDFTSPAGSGSVLKDNQSPHMSPKTAHNQSDVSNASAISDPTGSKFKSSHGRTARDLVQKTANMRAKNLGRPSPSLLLNVPQQGSGGLMKWKSDHALDSHFFSDSEKPKHTNSVSNFPYTPKSTAGYMYDDSVLSANSSRNAQLTGISLAPGHQSSNISQFRAQEGIQRVRTHSNSSSPSPSKDSGVSGMNLSAYRALPPGSDVSLMDRLLMSNVNPKQQRILGRIVHLLREEFAFDGYMENGVEDVNMAEYIASLGELKWETFTSAISEKYSDLYWGTDLLANLYNAVNRNRPSSASRGPSAHANRGQGQRVRSKRSGDNDDDSSSLSEPNENSGKKAQSRLQPDLPVVGSNVQKSSSNNVVNSNRQVDTSDSTDSENYGRRRRVKTKHELDKMKSSNSSGGIADSANTGTVLNSQRQGDMHTPAVNGSVTSPYSVVSSTGSPRSGLKSESTSNITTISSQNHSAISRQHSVDGLINSQNNHPSHSLSLSQSFERHHSVHFNQSPQSQTKHEHLSQSQPKMNGSVDVRGQSQGVMGSGLTRAVSMSSHSSSQSDIMKEGDAVAMEKKGHVVYHWMMIQLCMTLEMEKFMQGIDEENSKMLHTKLSALDQQLKMEKRVRRKTQKFYKSLLETSRNIVDTGKMDKTAKGEKSQKDQLARDITDMTERISFIDLCRSHLQMLLAELQGIDVSYLHSIAICPSCNPLQLNPRPDNPFLQFQTLREPHTGCEIQALHAGTPDGLMAYLFASTALSEGFIHQFLFCFRYFTTAQDVLTFLIDRYNSATKAGSTETNISRLQHRVVDLLHFWLEGYYSIDFQGRPTLLNTLRGFIRDSVKDESEAGENLLALLSNCASGHNLELSSADPDESEMHFWQREEPKMKWELLKSFMRGKSSAKEKAGKVQISAVCVERRRRSAGSRQEVISRGVSSRRANLFSVSDYTAQCLAEQLCLIEQGMFQLTHPVHYLDSKSRGVGVAMTMQSTRTPAVSRRSGIEESFGLFVEPLQDNTAIQKMIDHAEEVAHWVAAEIVVCSSLKAQVGVLAKFLFTAQACVELRNFATSMSILSGLENLIIKQLPAWKSLPNKCSNIMAELEATRMFLKNDPLSLMQQGKDCHLYPTIPSAVLFLLHIQQAEIGGFKLANQMFKWGKIRSIAQVIDQVRVFREHMYGFEADNGLQDTLRQRIHDMASQDIQTLASEHDINYQRLSSGSGLLKKMKGKLK